MTTLISCPVIANPERTRQSWERWDRPLLVIDNTESGAYAFLRERGHEVVWHSGENLGVARSWNIALDRGEALTVIVSQSVVFRRGLDDAVHKIEAATNEWGCLSTLFFHLTAWTRATVERIGRFDENFWPGWFEDNDWLRRLKLTGIHDSIYDLGLPKVSIPGSWSQTALTWMSLPEDQRADVTVRNAGYYARKWGGVPGDEGYDHPFADPRFGLDYWPTPDSLSIIP